MLKKLYRIVALLCLFLIMGLFLISLGNNFEPGIKEGILSPCPERPNCVSSFATKNQTQFLPHITYSISTDQIMSKLKNSLPPNAKIILEEGNYLHCEFKEGIWTDDVEFLIYPKQKNIHYRSSSRWGYDDLGANRNRMEKLKNALENS